MHSTRLRKQVKTLEAARTAYNAATDDAGRSAAAAVLLAEGQGFVEEIHSIADAAEANDKRVIHADEGKAAVGTALRAAGFAVDPSRSLQEMASAVALNTRRQGRRENATEKANAAALREELVSSGVLPDGIKAPTPAPTTKVTAREIVASNPDVTKETAIASVVDDDDDGDDAAEDAAADRAAAASPR